MQWPGTPRVATLPVQARRRATPPTPAGYDPVLDAAPVLDPTVPRARVFATRNPMDRKTLALTLVNWMFLLLLMCGFLLAKTLPADTTLSGGTTGSGVTATTAR
jgi:hypothetical protein